MKTINNNQLLLLFISLLISTQIFAQHIGHGMSKENKILSENTSLSKEFTIDKHSIILDEVEIILIMKPRTDSHKNDKSIVRNILSDSGESFCKMFCDFKQSTKVTYPFVVHITERLIKKTKSTEICILVNSNLIYKFRALNSPAYLNAAVQESNKRLDVYCLNNRQLYAGE